MVDFSQKFEKLFVQPYRDSKFTDPIPAKKFSALINPASYSTSYHFEYNDCQAPGTSSVELKFNKIKPQEFNFDFVFDGTGVVKDLSVISIGVGNPLEKPTSVTDQIDDFKLKIIDFQGDTHRPYYLKIHWGTLLFKGVLNQMDLEFKLFGVDGAPLRAIAKCKFTGSIEEKLRTALEYRQSPDVTHKRITKSTDRLDQMTNKIYNKPNNYIQIAKFNSMDSFRKVPTGTTIIFPPIEK